jgi:hypothetical protein
MILSRRKLIGGLGLLVAAPAVLRGGWHMPIKAQPIILEYGTFQGYSGYTVLNLTAADVLTSAEFDWVQLPLDNNM